MSQSVRRVAQHFAIPGALRSSEPHGSGHIHDTFVATYDEGGRITRYVLQRLNTRVFRAPEAVMENVVRITRHLAAKFADDPDAARRSLRVIPARDGRPFVVDAEGGFWRTYRFIEGARTYDTLESPEQAQQVARACGAFVALLDDLAGPPLAVTIPDFHDLPGRFAALPVAADEDPRNRACQTQPELRSAGAWFERLQRELAGCAAASLPRRIVHNDCKVNNVMLDVTSGEALCMIDLDTVMEGSLLSDFGELVRTAGCRSPEDTTDLDSMRVDDALLAGLARGFLAGGGGVFQADELRALPLAGPVMALENGIRFLTDHLRGDLYFRIHRPGHNLDRARAQLRLVALLAERLETLGEAIERGASETGPVP